VPYLTAVGQLKGQADNLDLEYAYGKVTERWVADREGEIKQSLLHTLQMKQSLLLRPLQKLLASPHLLSGWLSTHRDSYTLIDGVVNWNENPLELLEDTYYFLNMNYIPARAASSMIWNHDDEILETALEFYRELDIRLPSQDWIETQTLLDSEKSPEGIDDETWQRVRSAHLGFQAGMEILAVLPACAEATGFYQLTVNPDLTIHIPEELTEKELQDRMAKVLVPPPVAKSNEILAESGGMFYGRETPEHELYVNKGDHFEAGDPLFIVEVMKMFNKVYAPFAGTIDEVLVDTDGVIISKGQPIFKVTPDEKIVEESAEEVAARTRSFTDAFLDRI